MPARSQFNPACDEGVDELHNDPFVVSYRRNWQRVLNRLGKRFWRRTRRP